MENTLDYIISEAPERISELSTLGPLGHANQGHLCLIWNYKLVAPIITNKISSIKYIFKKGNYTKMNSELNDLKWNEIFAYKSTDECYIALQEIYNSKCDQNIPLKKFYTNRKQKAPWMNNAIMQKIKIKQSLWHKNLSKKFKCPILAQEYKKINSEIPKLTKEAVKTFEEELANDKKNPKRLYAYINNRQKVKQTINTLIVSGKTLTDKNDIVNALNHQFESVFVNETDISTTPEFPAKTDEKLSEVSFGEEKVIKHLKMLNTDKSQGSDKFHPYVLNMCAASLAKPISFIFQKSFESGELPKLWLEANVTPLFKKGSRLNPANYRPISLTSVTGKIMEKIIKDEIMEHLIKHNLINKHQYGFVYNKACVTNLLETMDLLTKLLSDKESFDLLLLDFEKAFDKVSHSRLSIKLTGHGISGKLLAWLNSFLSNRKQRVILGEFLSEWAKVNSGVIQWSVLGPILFIIFINDLIDQIKNSPKVFADDTKIISKINELNQENNLQADINNVLDWKKTWLMRLNLEKCKVIHFGKKNPRTSYTMQSYESNQRIQIQPTES